MMIPMKLTMLMNKHLTVFVGDIVTFVSQRVSSLEKEQSSLKEQLDSANENMKQLQIDQDGESDEHI